MPRYQYACTICGHDFEAVQSFTDDALTDCPACDGGRLRKVFGNVGVVFKGSGFYRTDSRSDGRKSGAPAPSPGDAKPAAAVGGKGDGGKSAGTNPPAEKAGTGAKSGTGAGATSGAASGSKAAAAAS